MYEDYVRRAILSGRGYDDLPPRVRASLTPSEWRARALAVCVARGAPWLPLPADLRASLPPERAYYEELLARHLQWRRPYPHHLASYTARVLRVTPFAYYSQMLAALLAAEGAYADLPNLTARDATAHTGVGRNAFIAALNGARGRRLLWRVNKAAAAREALPQRPPEPVIVAPEEEGAEGGEGGGGATTTSAAAPSGGHDAPLRVEPWWVVACVNVMEHELRELSPGEIALLRRAAAEGHGGTTGGDNNAAGGSTKHHQPPLLVRDVSSPRGAWHAAGAGPHLLASLWKRGLVYFDVPVSAGDRFVIPPLDSFVSNRNAPSGGETGHAAGGAAGSALGALVGAAGGGFDGASASAEDRADPREALLQAVLVASHARLTAADLADALGADAGDVAVALGLACRLGFALRVGAGGGGGASGAAVASSLAGPLQLGQEGAAAAAAAREGATATPPLSPSARDRPHHAETAAAAPPQAVAVVVDTQAAGLLMMGALSAGLKRHSVTLFEGGRIAADAVAGGGGGRGGQGSGGLVESLWESQAAGAALDGELKRLTAFAASLATLLEAAAAAADEEAADEDAQAARPTARRRRPVEVLRAETLAGLDPGAARRVLGGAYYALVPITPLPGPPLPLSPGGGGASGGSGAVTLGAFSPEAASPWLQLLLYAAAGSGPRSLALVRGQRLSRLPPALAAAAAAASGGSALLWPWDAAAAAADPALASLLGSGGAKGGSDGNDAALAAALAEAGAEEGGEGDCGSGGAAAAAAASGVAAALVEGGEGAVLAALNRMLTRTAVLVQAWGAEGDEGVQEAADIPLPLASSSSPSFAAVACSSGATVDVALPPAVPAALTRLGLDAAVGFLRVVKTGKGGGWVPLSVSLGVPLYRPSLCREVCRAAAAAAFLSPARVAAQARAQRHLQRALAAMAARFGAPGLVPPAASGRDDAAGAAAAVDLPACCLLFDGGQLGVVTS